MALIDVVEYQGAPGQLVWKFPSSDLSTRTQVIVSEGQEAVFMREGKALDVLGPGRHTLSTGNIPILEKLINLPFGGKTPFTAEVYYISKTTIPDVKWGTRTPIQIEDPKYGIWVQLRSFGIYGFRLIESRNFLTNLVGKARAFSLDDISDYLKSIILTRIQDAIAEGVVKQNISIIEISAYLDEVSAIGKSKLMEEFAKVGLELTDFYVNSINFPEDDPGVMELKKAKAERARLNILGEGYDKVRTYDTMEKAADNEGTMGGMMGAGMGLGMGANIGAAAGGMMSNAMQGQQGQQGGAQQQAQIACPKCQTPNPANSKFCANCGNKLEIVKIKCYKCGADINEDAKFCAECGAPQGKINCPKCNAEVQPGAKFCAECGNPMG